MHFLSGQDDFFRTGNQPISVRHLSQPYNNIPDYFVMEIDKFNIYMYFVPNFHNIHQFGLMSKV